MTIPIPVSQLQTFFLIFVRVAAVMMSVPIFDSKNVPPLFKIGMSLAISICLFPALQIAEIPLLTQVVPMALGISREIIFGICIGFSVRIMFSDLGIELFLLLKNMS